MNRNCRHTKVTEFQLTTSRRGRRYWHYATIVYNIISTHDLTKRSTRWSALHWFRISISTHDLTKRSTVISVNALNAMKFQLTTSRRGRQAQNCSSTEICAISTHDLTKRSTFFSLLYSCTGVFQLTTSRRGRRKLISVYDFLVDISTHDLTKRSTRRREKTACGRDYFNSRPHEEVDKRWIVIYSTEENISTHDLTKRSTGEEISHLYPTSCISTHDLTKRSTLGRGKFRFWIFISTHDLTKRSTIMGRMYLIMRIISTHDLTKRSTNGRRNGDPSTGFQLTTSRRGRLCAQGLQESIFQISTHDLTKRSTAVFPISLSVIFKFQLTTSRRGRPVCPYPRMHMHLFQLTTSRRGRPTIIPHRFYHIRFQLTTSRRGRRRRLSGIRPCTLFQLTTSRRGRQYYSALGIVSKHFNSRPHEEVDCILFRLVSEFGNFNSRPHEEVDQKSDLSRIVYAISTHDLTKRST